MTQSACMQRATAILATLVAAPLAVPLAAGAQTMPPRPVACAGQVVREIVIYASAPTVAGSQRVPVLRDLVRTMHMTTDPELTRRFLQLAEGEPCTELRRTESERVLRAQPFIADANVLAYADSSDGVRVEVHTIDEASLLAGARVAGDPFVGLVRLGNTNLAGRGKMLQGEWRHGGVHRDGWSVAFSDHQVAGRPWVFDAELRRAPLGGRWSAELARPFLTDLQRSAWRVHGGETMDYVRLEHPELASRAMHVSRGFADVGVLSRIGPPRRLALVGLSLSHERERTGAEMQIVERWGLGPDTLAQVSDVYGPHTMTRFNLLGGVRLLDYVRVQGFDGLSATQDFPVGLQTGVIVGKSLATPGARDEDWYTALDVYAAAGTETWATRVRAQGEGRLARAQNRWDGIAVSGALTHYAKQGLRNTTVLSAEWAGVWHSRVPGQLLLGAADGGVRGFGDSRVGGARRAVVRAEQRRVLRRINGSAEIGMALFADAGRTWAGDVPLGLTTPWRASAGVSLLAAMPVRSARLWRVDLAVPSTGGGIRRWEVRVTRAGPYSMSREEPSPVQSVRARAVPGSVFLWP